MSGAHVPVLAGELLALIEPGPGETAVDCTFGAGGHARIVSERLGATGTLVCIDRDPAAEAHFAALAAELPCATRFLRMEFADGLELLLAEGLRADIVYFDLGVSSMQVDARERGFSYSYDAPLDMRMDPGRAQTARELVNELDERRLARLFRSLGEEPNARQIARELALPAAVRHRFGSGHPARRVFQALRIAVNDELEQLDRALPAAWELLRPGGRLAAISFHSLEDRRVKRFMADKARGCVCPPDFPVCVCGREVEAEILTRRPVAPTPGEISHNPRARSGRLRVARKLGSGKP